MLDGMEPRPNGRTNKDDTISTGLRLANTFWQSTHLKTQADPTKKGPLRLCIIPGRKMNQEQRL